MKSLALFCLRVALFLPSTGCSAGWALLSGHSDNDGPKHDVGSEKGKVPATPVGKQSEWVKAKYLTECVVPDAEVQEPIEPVENAEQWTQLWLRLQPDKPVPEVNFDKSLVCTSIGDAGDTNLWGDHFYREVDGTIRTQRMTTAMYCEPTDQTKVRFYLVPRNRCETML